MAGKACNACCFTLATPRWHRLYGSHRWLSSVCRLLSAQLAQHAKPAACILVIVNTAYVACCLPVVFSTVETAGTGSADGIASASCTTAVIGTVGAAYRVCTVDNAGIAVHAIRIARLFASEPADSLSRNDRHSAIVA